MSREVRRVPTGWEHPKSKDGQFIPLKKDCMPDFNEGDLCYMMYEISSEGTPISPAFKMPEELAVWLYETSASSFGSQGTSYLAWLRVIKGISMHVALRSNTRKTKRTGF
ncbi:MAG: hypothetical protein QNK20_05155 [Aureibaculum sp.]|nr:hypothetical protein [Aureibaculum sp.]